MLQKRIDLGSIPHGLAVAGEDLIKGTLVKIEIVKGQETATKATNKDEAVGFVTYRFEEKGGADKDFDLIKKGQRVVIYTLVSNNVWGTTEFDASIVQGDLVKVTAGKLAKATTRNEALGQITNVYAGGNGYTDAMVDVKILPYIAPATV